MRKIPNEEIARLLETADKVTTVMVTELGIGNDQVSEISDAYEASVNMLYMKRYEDYRLFRVSDSTHFISEIAPTHILATTLRSCLRNNVYTVWELSPYETSFYCDIRDYKAVYGIKGIDVIPVKESFDALEGDWLRHLVEFTICGPDRMLRQYWTELSALRIEDANGVPMHRSQLTEQDVIARLNYLLFDNSGFMVVERAFINEVERTTTSRIIPFEIPN